MASRSAALVALLAGQPVVPVVKIEEVPEAIVGAGTILNVRDFDNVERAGSRFIVSPGQTADLLRRAKDSGAAFLPGAITPAEMMVLLENDYTIGKFFPAEQAGGMPFLKALASPFPGLSFCPTGGVSMKNAAEYLALPNVVCVGGSWVAPDDALAAGDWARITRLAGEAAALRKK
jgi:2-dehydro-3-deoxyphosphogluconate aldolase/(4S)-4-hydroxy-2-oxoglutarate aldolase